MKNLIENLNRLSRQGAKPSEILTVLEKAQLSPQSVNKYSHFEDAFYTRNLIFKNELFEVLLLCWKPGHITQIQSVELQRGLWFLLLLCWKPGHITQIHDHAAQSCWMTVLQGIITSENYKYVAPYSFDGTLEKTSTESFKTGQSYYIDDQVSLHLLKNPVKCSEQAMSLHIYSKPFSSCTVYDRDLKKTNELTLAYHSMGGKKGSWIARDIKNLDLPENGS